jgi:Ca2+/Na+ antiporter
MWIMIILFCLFILYLIILFAIDSSQNTKLLKENYKVLIEIRELLKNQNKNS